MTRLKQVAYDVQVPILTSDKKGCAGLTVLEHVDDVRPVIRDHFKIYSVLEKQGSVSGADGRAGMVDMSGSVDAAYSSSPGAKTCPFY